MAETDPTHRGRNTPNPTTDDGRAAATATVRLDARELARAAAANAQPDASTEPPRMATIIVDDSLGAVEVEATASDTVRLDADELKRRIAALEADNADPFAKGSG